MSVPYQSRILQKMLIELKRFAVSNYSATKLRVWHNCGYWEYFSYIDGINSNKLTLNIASKATKILAAIKRLCFLRIIAVTSKLMVIIVTAIQISVKESNKNTS